MIDTADARREYYYGLDIARFIAATSVAWFHLGFLSWAAPTSTTAEVFGGGARFESLAPYSWFGWVGVEVFFVISGFVIANSASGASPTQFLRGRALRLYPAAWICATCTLLVLLAVRGGHFTGAGRSYLNSMILWPPGWCIDGVYWTLGIEVMFYGLIFLVLVFRQFHRLNWIAWFLTLSSVAT
jgi:exopolysaccharide production protein ExoZ